MRVLLVEDHADTRELLVTFFSKQGYDVETAVTGLQGIDKALLTAPDVIVLDLELPGLDGWSAARHLRAHPLTRNIPIVACSGHAYPHDEAKAQDVGCDAFLAKPCAPTDVLDAIERVLDKPRV